MIRELLSKQAFRKTLKASRMLPALAGRILHSLYTLRKAYPSSYILASFTISAVSLSSYFFWSLVASGIVSSYSEFWLKSIIPLMMLCSVLHGDDNHENSSHIEDHDEDLGGNGPRVAAYLRVSTGRQAKEGFSLPVQQEQLTKLKDQVKPSKIYWLVDAGKSGVTFDNRKVISIMQLAKNKEIGEFWVTQVDRIGRESIENLRFFLNLCKEGVQIRTPEKLYKIKDLGSLLTYVIEALAAEEENKRRAKSSMASKIQRFRGKKWNKTSIPLGYKKRGDWLEKNPAWEPIAKETYQHYLRARNFESVKKYINSKYNESLTRYQVRSMLSDPIYIGKPQHLGEVVHDPSLAHINEQTFVDVQEAIKCSHDKHRPSRVDPLKDLVETQEISALDLLDQLELRHKQCGGLAVKNGTKTVGELRRQILRCKECKRQWVVPSNAQLKRIKEYNSWKDDSGSESRHQQSDKRQTLKTNRNGLGQAGKDRNLAELLK